MMHTYNLTLPDDKKCALRQNLKGRFVAVCHCGKELLLTRNIQPLQTHHNGTCSKNSVKGSSMLGFYKKDFTFSTMVQKQSIAFLTDAGKWLRELVSTNGMKELEVMYDLIGKLGFKAKIVAFRLDQDTKKLKLDRTLGEGPSMHICNVRDHFFAVKRVADEDGEAPGMTNSNGDSGLWKGVAKYHGEETERGPGLPDEVGRYEAQDYGQYGWGTGSGLEHDEFLKKTWRRTLAFTGEWAKAYSNNCALISCIVALLSNKILTKSELTAKLATSVEQPASPSEGENDEPRNRSRLNLL